MKRLAASCFGLGRLPLAPGTWGSLPVVVVFALLCYLGAGTVAVSIVMAALALAGSVICVKCAPAVIAATGSNDPREVVADEFAGQALTFLAVGTVARGHIGATAVLGFLLFRLFDIAKPWPIRRLEKLPKGLGILADDLMAAVYAAILLFVSVRIGLVEYVSSSLGSGSGPLNILDALLLGSVQGLTEFLPVSSSGHLVLFETIFGFDPETPEMLLFDLAVHVGTVAAIFIVFRKSIVSLLGNLTAYGRYGTNPIEIYRKSPSIHLLVLAAVATVVTGVLGLLFKKYFASARGSLAVVALMWIVTGTLLLITDWRRKARLSLRQFGITAAIVVGLAQAAAIMPGISRSGVTICAAILIGLHRRWAVEFSFLIAIPAILGATAVELARDFTELGSAGLPLGPVLAGAVTAAGVGILALKLLIRASRKANLKFFAIYCYIMACCVLIYLSR